jgi:tetratricopeptide (TPR) repeat protein
MLYWTTLGQLDQAIVALRKALSLDPGNAAASVFLGLVYLDLAAPDKAAFWINRGYEIVPDGLWTTHAKAWLHWSREQHALATEFANRAIEIDPSLGWGATLAYLRNRDIAIGNIEAARARYAKFYPELFDRARPEINAVNYRLEIDIAWLLKFTGEQARASYLMEASLEVINGLSRLGEEGYRVADFVIYTLQGKKGLALSALRDAVDQGWRNQWWLVASHDPSLESIRSEKEFKKIIDRLRAEMRTQLESVRQMDTNGVLAPVVSIHR